MTKEMKKNRSRILQVSIFAITFLAVLIITSCNSNKDAKDSKEVAEEHNDAKFTNAKEDDAGFLVSAAEINLEEIQFGQLAQTNSRMPEVKELGKMMESEHTKALSILQILTSKKQVTIPTTITNDGKDAYDKLKSKFGSEFDNEYCDMMVKGHKDAISKFEKASIDTKDADIQNWAASLLISLRMHLDQSISCQEKCAKMKSNPKIRSHHKST